MAYTVHGFQSGETLYAEQLNEMDEQIAENERTAASAQSTAEAARTAAVTAQNSAQHAAERAEEQAQTAETWAVGTKGGIDVEPGPGDPRVTGEPSKIYNSKYFASISESHMNAASASSQGAAQAAQDAQNSMNQAYMYSNSAQRSAEAAEAAASSMSYDLESISDGLKELGVNVDNLQAATYRESEGRTRIVDALEARLRELQVYGRSDQEPDKGSEYQLIPWSPGYTSTQRGVTVTVDADQRLSISGTATADGVVQCCAIPFAVEAGEDYTMISNNTGIGYVCVSGSQWIQLYPNTNNQFHRNVVFQAESISGVHIYVANGKSYNLTGVEFMLCKGKFNPPNLPAWEPFISAGPLYPAPETPMPPRAVTGFSIRITDRAGAVKHELNLTPPRPLYGLGAYGDVCDPEHGVWKYFIRKTRVTGDMIAYSVGSFTNTDAYAVRNAAIGRIGSEMSGAGSDSPTFWDLFRKDNSFWSKDEPYTAFDEKAVVQFKLPKGTDAAAWLLEHETNIWAASAVAEEVEMDAATAAALKALKSYNREMNISVTDQDGRELKTDFLYQLNLSAMFDGSATGFDFTALHLATDGDSTTTEGPDGSGMSWPYYMNRKLNFASKTNVAMGNAMTRDRSSNTSGTVYTTQWKPDVGDAWLDYWGLEDPHYAGGESEYESGTAEFDQATANNCLYGHIGYFIDGVQQERFPKPDIFILAMQGVNDLWGANASAAESIIGTVDGALAGDWENLSRDTVLKALRWALQRLRKEYPKCRLFYKTAAQKSAVSHPGYPLLEDRVLALCRALSVPVIDSFGELGVQTEFESGAAANNQWSGDGVHPTQAGYEKDGLFTAARLKGYFI